MLLFRSSEAYGRVAGKTPNYYNIETISGFYQFACLRGFGQRTGTEYKRRRTARTQSVTAA